MGAKTCLVAQVQGDARGILSGYPDMQESTTTNFVASLFPDARFGAPQATDLSHTYLSDKSVIAGCTPGLGIVVSAEVAMDRPSELPRKFIAEKGTTILHAMHSVVDWFAFAVWGQRRHAAFMAGGYRSGSGQIRGTRRPPDLSRLRSGGPTRAFGWIRRSSLLMGCQ